MGTHGRDLPVTIAAHKVGSELDLEAEAGI
jgi:hypothetical protein